jgi:hypothetical protein
VNEHRRPHGEADPDLLPVSGVSLDLFARISRELAAFRYDPHEATRLAELHGVEPDDWHEAAQTWSRRLRENSHVAEQFRAAFGHP